jgi:hypothetical protein
MLNTPIVPAEVRPGDDFLYEYGHLELKKLSDDFDSLDEKTAVVLGFALVSIAEILGFLLLGAAEQNHIHTTHPIAFSCFFYTGLGLTMASVFTGLLELLPRNYDAGPTLEDLRPLAGEAPEKIKAALIHALDTACDHNDDINTTKWRFAVATAILVGVSLICYAVAAAYLFASAMGW